MMKHKPFLLIQYKYPYEAWTEYDRTKVVGWARTQSDRCKSEHPGAEVRIIPLKKV